MATWTSFYVQTANQQSLVEELKSLSHIQQLTVGEFPSNLQDRFVSENAPPNYLAIATTQPGWITVVHNGVAQLEEWGIHLSREFNTQVIFTAAQSVSSYYYFALYEFGEKKRELEFCYSDDSEPVIVGAPLPFEGEAPGERDEYDGEVTYVFDFDSIERYCQQLGLIIQRDYREYEWTILRKKGNATQTPSKNPTKPWWKFW
ncbi:hypothetical protein [Paraflavitalea pollutisoli]|uniref:hypothetical protein n=1 Tax=Paraflavitalea pollutisoli TaxID=3034143 RepID=UPI0023EAEAA1|nr:hypothetical protein [Paraflavitalea sp. H1-2-19X]